MKKVLIIGHFWPYRNGSRRVIGLAKYLSEFGWEPIILTGSLKERPAFQFRVIEVPCKDIFYFWTKILKFLGFNSNKSMFREVKKKIGITSKKSFIDFLLSFYSTLFAYPDGYKNWMPLAIKACSELFDKEKIDAIISIWPVTCHLIAKELKNKYKIPWIADFPDLWSQNDEYPYVEIRRKIDRRLEIKTLLSADALTAISESMVENLKKIHKQKIICKITHGFDPEKVNIPATDLIPKFIITYTGQVFPVNHDPTKLLMALNELILEGKINKNDIEVRFYGPEENWLEEEVKRYNLDHIVHQYGIIPREECFNKQRESQVLLLFKLEDPTKRGAYHGKIFEYLAAHRPILAIGGSNDVVTDLLKETGAGIEAPNVEDVKNSIEKLYTEYKLKGRVVYNGDIKEIDKYSEREMTKKFANILNQIIK